MSDQPTCEACQVPSGHGWCQACFTLRYPDGKGGCDWKRAWMTEGDISKLPERVRLAAWEMMQEWKREHGED